MLHNFYMYKANSWHYIKFLDHCNGFEADKPMIIEIFIYVIEDKKDYIYGTTWRPVTDDQEIYRDNLEKVSIIKSTILESNEIV